MTDKTTSNETDAVKVEQCDRDEAAEEVSRRGLPRTLASDIRSGIRDYHHTVQAFARHRIAAEQRAHSTDGAGLLSEKQAEVGRWMLECFGYAIANNRLERADRFIEEALELAQTCPEFSADRAHALVDYVFSRPVGETEQEIGGVMVTLAALCNTGGYDIQEAMDREVARIWTKVEAIRAKQAAKPVGSALPMATPAPIDGPRIPDGYVLVKRTAAIAARNALIFKSDVDSYRDEIAEFDRAMLTAAEKEGE